MGTFLGNVLRGAGKIAKGLPVVGGLITGIEQENQAGKIKPVDTTYSINPEAQRNLSLALSMLNARAPGAAATTQNINNTAGNMVSNINRNATSGAQAIALASGVQGQTNNAFLQQEVIEGQNFRQNLNNLQQAQQVMIGEGDKVYQDLLRKFNNDTNQKNQLMNAGQQNIKGAWNDALNIGLSVFGGGKNKSMFSGISDSDLINEYNRF